MKGSKVSGGGGLVRLSDEAKKSAQLSSKLCKPVGHNFN